MELQCADGPVPQCPFKALVSLQGTGHYSAPKTADCGTACTGRPP